MGLQNELLGITELNLTIYIQLNHSLNRHIIKVEKKTTVA